MESRKRPTIVICLPSVIIGCAGFHRVMRAPHFGIYRAVDFVQPLGSGVWFSASPDGIIFMFRTGRH